MSKSETEIVSAQPKELEQAEPNRLLELALKSQVPVETIERLVALQERAEDRRSRIELAEALNKAQSEIPSIPETAEAKIVTKSGGSYRYKYAPLDQIVKIVRPILSRHGLSFSWDSITEENKVRVTCKVEHVGGHFKVATFEAPVDQKAVVNDMQKHAIALTYAQRKSLVQVLGLTTSEPDTDGNDPAAVEHITPEQAADLQALIDEVNADLGRFLKYLGVESVESIPASQFKNAVRMLERKRASS
jgi:hypothetical protein